MHAARAREREERVAAMFNPLIEMSNMLPEFFLDLGQGRVASNFSYLAHIIETLGFENVLPLSM